MHREGVLLPLLLILSSWLPSTLSAASQSSRLKGKGAPTSLAVAAGVFVDWLWETLLSLYHSALQVVRHEVCSLGNE